MTSGKKNESVIVLNDQGGGVMNVTYDVANTLRAQDHGHPPLVLDIVQTVYDASRRHSYESFGDICGTVQAHFGTGGGNVPLVLEKTREQDAGAKTTEE